jgi:hypothetical protein
MRPPMPEWLEEGFGQTVEEPAEKEELRRASNSHACRDLQLPSYFVVKSQRKTCQVMSLLRPDNSPPKKGANHA